MYNIELQKHQLQMRAAEIHRKVLGLEHFQLDASANHHVHKIVHALWFGRWDAGSWGVRLLESTESNKPGLASFRESSGEQSRGLNSVME